MTKALQLFRSAEIRPVPIPVTDVVARKLATQADRTREAYAHELRQFADFVKCDTVDEAVQRLIQSDSAIAQDVVLSFQGQLIRSGLAPSTINGRIAALRSVLKIARAIGATTVRLDLVDRLDPEPDRRNVKGPGIDVIRHLIETCEEAGGPAGLRDAAIIRWLVGTGLRREELRVLTLNDYRPDQDGSEGVIMVKQKKKRRKHPIRITGKLIECIQPWLRVRGESPGALFPSLDHRVRTVTTLGKTGLNQIIRRRAIQAGYPNAKLPDGRGITPHGLRHTAITRMIQEFGIAAANAFARHANIATTQIYNDEKKTMALDGQAFIFGLL